MHKLGLVAQVCSPGTLQGKEKAFCELQADLFYIEQAEIKRQNTDRQTEDGELSEMGPFGKPHINQLLCP